MNIALITPLHKEDYMTNTILDGLLTLTEEGKDWKITYSSEYETYLPIQKWWQTETDFLNFAKTADIIFFFWGKNNTDFALYNKVNRPDKTVFIDGSELGGNLRLDAAINEAVNTGVYKGQGAIDNKLLSEVALYFRRERPYPSGIIPLPFGIERRYVRYNKQVKKEIDIVSVFGQEEFPPLRKEIRHHLESKPFGLNIVTKRTDKKWLSFFIKKNDGRQKFYDLLARAKCGVSVSGGGYDTARFWEILANNCILLTEKIGIYHDGDPMLKYKRIWQFTDIEDFKMQISKFRDYLATTYNELDMQEEYERILKEHSSKARVITVLEKCRERGLIDNI